MKGRTAAALAAAVLWACAPPQIDHDTVAGAMPAHRAAAPDAARHELGRKVYNFRCYYCHGYSGDAATLAASFLPTPPRNFTALAPADLSRAAMLDAVRDGRPDTAMKGFRGILSHAEMGAVVDFVRWEFMARKARNTHYHTAQNGWPDHERHREAFPYALGEIALDTPWENLSESQQRGRRLYLATCVSCHDRGRATGETTIWEPRPLSYPRNDYQPGDWPPAPKVDAVTSASPYGLHDVPPKIADLTPAERRGERLFQANCAFCHAADGTGKNWIGSFMEPHPRNLTDPAFMQNMTRARLRKVIAEGLPETSMPAWRDVLSPAEIDDVVAYVGRAFHRLPD
jgi:cytochrome c oxidase cbb3-type subunit 3